MIVSAVIAGRRARMRRRAIVSVSLAAVVAVLFALTLMIGNTVYGLGDVMRVIAGREVVGASFTVGQLRLPRATLGLLSGACFGVAGVTFQTMLRNPLASPDIIGINSGACAAAVVGIVVFSFGETAVSLMALGGALLTALLMYVLSSRGGFSGSRLVLIGVGLTATLQSVVSYVLSRAAAWDLQTAMRWLSGSLNGATWQRVTPLAIVTAIFATTVLLRGRDLGVLRLGDESAASLGVGVGRTRVQLMLAAVALLAFATASAGPIAFVAFMSGPIAARLVGSGAALAIPSGLVGASLVLGADLIGQNVFVHRYPVGVVTGVLGAPYLLALLIKVNRSGGSL